MGRSDCHILQFTIKKLLVIGICRQPLGRGKFGNKTEESTVVCKACLGDSQGWVDPQINVFFQFIYHGSKDLNLQYSNYGDTFVPWKKCHQVLRIAD